MEDLPEATATLLACTDAKQVDSALKKLLGYARVDENRRRLVEEAGLLTGLVTVLVNGNVGSREKVVSTLTLLSFKADDDVLVTMTEEPGLLQCLMAVVRARASEENDRVPKARTRSLRVLKNLFNGEGLQHELFYHPNLIESLLSITQLDEVSLVKEDVDNVLGMIRNMSEADGLERELFDCPTLMEVLVKMVRTEATESKMARENAVVAIRNISSSDSFEKDLFEFPGLVEVLVEAIGRTGKDNKRMVENGLQVLVNISCGEDTAVKKGVFEFPGLLGAFLKISGKVLGEEEEKEYRVAREKVLSSIKNISCCNGLEKELFESAGIMDLLIKVLSSDSEDRRKERKRALAIIRNISVGEGLEAALFEMEDLMFQFVRILGKRGGGYKEEREHILVIIRNISSGGLTRRLNEYPELLRCLERMERENKRHAMEKKRQARENARRASRGRGGVSEAAASATEEQKRSDSNELPQEHGGVMCNKESDNLIKNLRTFWYCGSA